MTYHVIGRNAEYGEVSEPMKKLRINPVLSPKIRGLKNPTFPEIAHSASFALDLDFS
jgi:hypothetical protein